MPIYLSMVKAAIDREEVLIDKNGRYDDKAHPMEPKTKFELCKYDNSVGAVHKKNKQSDVASEHK